MKKTILSRKFKAALASATLGVVMAQTLVIITTDQAYSSIGSCVPARDYVCCHAGSCMAGYKYVP